MSIKLRLFASVAIPVLSLPLLMQPAYAIPPGIGSGPSLAKPGVIRVQQEVIPEEGQEGQTPRRQPDAEQPQEQPAQREQGAQQDGGETPKPREQQAEQPQEQPRQSEQQNAERPAGERPERREQRAQEDGGGEKPKRREQQAEQPQEQPSQSEQKNAEQPEGERPQRRQQRAQEEGGGERPKRREQQAEQPKPTEEPAKQNADQAPEPKQAEPAQRQAEDPKPTEQNADQPAAAQPQQRNAEQPQGERPRREQKAQDGQAVPSGATPEQTTSGGERTQQPAAAQQAEQPATLPVENGAAVLDSAKEQRPQRNGERRDPNRAGGQQVPGQPAPGQQPDAQQAQERAAPPPRTDADAQANEQITREQREQWRSQRQELVEERGERMDGRPDFERPRGWDVRGPLPGGDRQPGRDRDRDRDSGRVIISIDNQTIVRHDDSRRFYEEGRQPEYERLGDGRYREVVQREDGTRVVTIRNRYGEVVQRSRVVRGGQEYVLYYAPELLEDREDYTWRDPGDDLPPMRLGVPIDDYIIDTSSEPDRDYYEFLEQPPVERVERPYSLDEVRYSARIRDKVPRIDLDTITFATGSAEVPMNQASSLRKVADAINKVLKKDPAETFLIEGHTDAVGSDDSNLVLSDRRAESVAVVLSDAFGIPPENLTTQGYGERYLKVNTEAANQENRRVTIRRITPLVKPVAAK